MGDTAQSTRIALDGAPEVTKHAGIQRQVIGDFADRCSIQPGCLEPVWPLSLPACYPATMAKLHAFIEADPALRDYPEPLFIRHCGRSALVAAEMLGDDSHLTDEQLERKAAFHLMMTVDITQTWLLDDALDENSTDPLYGSALANLDADMIEGDPADLPERVAAIRANSSQQGIPRAHIDALLPLCRWRRSLLLEVGIPLRSSSLAVKVRRCFLDSLLRTHEPFHTWQAYESHRSHNSGMHLLMVFSTYWNCYRWQIDPSPMERDQDRFLSILFRYGGLGGLSNDLFGYEKDVMEGVATAVDVAKRTLLGGAGDDEQLTHAAFARVCDIHNERLNELVRRAETCGDPLEAAMLYSGLRAAWSLRALHQEYSGIYRAGWLAKSLQARAMKLPLARSA